MAKILHNLAKKIQKAAMLLSGGEMGWRNLADLPSLFADALKNKKKGYISPPLKSGSGFYILKLEDKRGILCVLKISGSPSYINDDNKIKR